MLVNEEVQRQIAIAAVVPVKEPPFLLSVHGIISGVQIQNDALRLPRLGLDVEIHQQTIDGRLVHDDLFVASIRLGIRRRQFQPV